MKPIFTAALSLMFLTNTVTGQDSMQVNQMSGEKNKTRSQSPYHTSFKKDAPILGVGLGLTALGVTLIQNKDTLTYAELATKTRDKVPFFDRGNVGNYNKKIDKDSYIPFNASFAMPVIMMLINKNERQHAGQVIVMYVESMAVTGAAFTLAAGIFNRSRPLVYPGGNPPAPLSQKVSATNQRSFFAGHTAATASATFFMAKVFQDFNPNSKAKPYVWALAAAVPALVGYMRYESGYHFLSDNVLGYVIGAASGILIPEWHKSKVMKNLSFVPEVGKNYKGIAFTYKLK